MTDALMDWKKRIGKEMEKKGLEESHGIRKALRQRLSLYVYCLGECAGEFRRACEIMSGKIGLEKIHDLYGNQEAL